MVSSEAKIAGVPLAAIKRAALADSTLSVYARPAYSLCPLVVLGILPSIVMKTSAVVMSKDTALVFWSNALKVASVDAVGSSLCEDAPVVGFGYRFTTYEFMVLYY